MARYLAASAWGLVILAAFYGWGAMASRALGRRSEWSSGYVAALGLAVVILIGGILNLVGWISRATSVGVVLIGVLVAVICRRDWFPPARRSWRAVPPILSTLVVALLLSNYAASVRTGYRTGPVGITTFNAHDDFHAYLVFPEKMLARGSLGPEPFSERRLSSALGGQSYLQTLVLSLFPSEYLHLVDPGVPLLLLCWVLASWRGLARRTPAGVALILLALLLSPAPTANTSSVLTGATLALALIQAAPFPGRHGAQWWPDPVGYAIVAAACIALKMSLLPFVLLLMAAHALVVHPSSPWRNPLVRFGLLLGGVVVFMMPWMVALKLSSGTFLYPVLGKGVGEALLSGVLAPPVLTGGRSIAESMIRAVVRPEVIAVLLMGGALIRWSPVPGPVNPWPPMLAVVGGSLSVAYAVGGANDERLVFPFLLAGILGLALAVLDRALTLRRSGWRSWALLLTLAAAVAMSVGAQWQRTGRHYLEVASAIGTLRSEPSLATNDEIRRYHTMQAAVPPGDVILARLSKPFLLRFDRNPVYIIDWPGGASPAPGLPVSDLDELISYLRRHGIRAVAYSYRDEAGFSRRCCAERLTAGVHPWVREQARHTFDFQDALDRLRQVWPVLYDDGSEVVIDVSQPRMSAP